MSPLNFFLAFTSLIYGKVSAPKSELYRLKRNGAQNCHKTILTWQGTICWSSKVTRTTTKTPAGGGGRSAGSWAGAERRACPWRAAGRAGRGRRGARGGCARAAGGPST